ncbi:MAG: MFS transporter [Caulobacteraceae bacterium]
MNTKAASGARTPLSTILLFAGGSPALSALGLAMAIYVQPYFAKDLGVGLVTIAFAFGVVRLLDLGVDPVLALLMDRTTTPIGRYRVWLIGGIPILMLSVYELFMARPGIGVAFLIVWLLVNALGTSLVGLSRAAWSTVLVTRYDQRARFYGYLAAIGAIGSFIVLGTPVISKFLGPGRPNDVQLMGWTALVLIPVGLGLSVFFVPERINRDAGTHHFKIQDYVQIARKPEVMRLTFSAFALSLGPGWMANLYMFFFTDARGFDTSQASILLAVYVFSGVLGAPLVGYLGGKLSKHRTMMLATVLYSLGLCSVVITPKGDLLAAIPVMVWCGFMAIAFDLMTSAMMADVGDQVRLEQGKERMALLFSLTGLAAKLAAAGAVMIAYPLLAAVGYVPKAGAHNTTAAIQGLELLFIVGPIFWVILGGACFLGWKLDARKHAAIRVELEARDALATAGEVVVEETIVAVGGASIA